MNKQEIILKVCDLLTEIGLDGDDETFIACEEIRNALPESYSAENKVQRNAPVDIRDSMEQDNIGDSGEQETSYAEIDEE